MQGMPINPEWSDIAVRLLCTVLAGMLIGLNRGEHGRPAGLRTTLLVALAACLSMIQVNLLLPAAGKPATSFVVLDLMRLPLGILSGIGFIGAGAIVRRDNFVVGVTTAATLWFVTVLGLCFGGGQILLGLVGLAAGLIVLTGLKQVEERMKHDRQGTLSIVIDPSGPGEDEIRTGVVLRRWFALEDMLIGADISDTLDIKIAATDRVLVILSKNSLGSAWVENEAKKAMAEERKKRGVILMPLQVDDSIRDTDMIWVAQLRETIARLRPAQREEAMLKAIREA
jgi:putative Mg2+ transporter-C (MgtC) family protein